MVISAVRSSALDRTLPTIRNKSGFQELSKTGAQSMHLMLSELICPTLFLTMLFCRCDAEPNDLDAACSHQRTHEKTDYLIKNFDPGILWDEYGIRADIVVHKISHGYIFILTVACSHLPMDFCMQIFMNCYRLISCISSSKVSSRTTL